MTVYAVEGNDASVALSYPKFMLLIVKRLTPS
jgi:hypothetical protein